MAKVELSRVGELVKKANALVRGQISIDSVDGGRILAALVSCIRIDDTELSCIYRLNVIEILAKLERRDYGRISKACETLGGCFAKIEILRNKDNRRLKIIPLFSELDYNQGIITAKFNIAAKPYILQLQEHFTEYSLSEFIKLSSIYSQRLFEILKSWSNTHEKIYTIEELHSVLNTPISLQRDFYNFKARVLEQAHKDITEKTSLRYDWEPVKTGRKVTAIRFVFKKGRPHKLPMPASKLEQPAQSPENTRMIDTVMRCWKENGGRCSADLQPEEVCALCRKVHRHTSPQQQASLLG